MTNDAQRRRITVDGIAVLDYVDATQARPVADDVRALAPLDLVVDVVLDRFADRWFTSDDDALTDALLARGASLVRLGHVFTLPLPRRDGLPRVSTVDLSSSRIEAIDRSPHDLGELSLRAYPATHVDFETDVADVAADEIRGLLDGSILGPCIRTASAQVIDRGRLVAACIVNRAPGTPPWGGPWVSNVFRDPVPAYRGLGAVLLHRAVTVLEAAGESALGLAVTEGNPAMDLYRSMGFEHVAGRRKLLIPAH